MSKGYIILTLEFKREGRRWLASCKELGTATFGRSLKEAEEKLKEACFLHVSTLEDVGERERFFRENNITFHHIRPKSGLHVRVPVNSRTYFRPVIQNVRELASTN